MIAAVTSMQESALFITKLTCGSELGLEDRINVTKALCRLRHFTANTVVLHEGDKPKFAHVVMEGFACKYKTLRNGHRQIVAYLLPGDMCEPYGHVGQEVDYSIATLAKSTIARLASSDIDALIADSPKIKRALRFSSIISENISREWLTNMGQRSAEMRLAHLLCELHARLRAVGLAELDAFNLPITQTDLGDTLGLSSVHVNRCLQLLKQAQWITLRKRRLNILDFTQLKRFCDFNPRYLCLRPVVDQPQANAPTPVTSDGFLAEQSTRDVSRPLPSMAIYNPA